MGFYYINLLCNTHKTIQSAENTVLHCNFNKRKSKQRGSESGKEAAQVVEWTAQRKSETRVEDKGESEEASAGNESDGRQKEIADETIVGQ